MKWVFNPEEEIPVWFVAIVGINGLYILYHVVKGVVV